jgi:hypothetical protein
MLIAFFPRHARDLVGGSSISEQDGNDHDGLEQYSVDSEGRPLAVNLVSLTGESQGRLTTVPLAWPGKECLH